MRRALFALAAVVAALPLHAQTIDDAVMMPKRALCAGFGYANDSWDQYWEGSLKRDNGNVGTVTTQNVALMGAYGVTDRLNILAMLPYVWTNASQGVLHGMSGIQDVTVAAKYTLLRKPVGGAGSVRFLIVGTAGTPAGDYTPDFLPLSIGMASSRLSGRATGSLQTKPGLFLNASAAYTWRGNVTLDRASYFTDGQLFHTDEVEMPNVFDYTVTAGYRRGPLYVPISFTRQSVRGGGDIRRQDMPFVSNRMNYSRLEGTVQYYLPPSRNLSVKLGLGRTLSGRNVGQSTTVTGGLLYTFHF
jgi:hypothetical protein